MTLIKLSLAVIPHRHSNSRYLINILHKFGICVSYTEVLNYEACTADQLGTDLHDIDIDSFLHFPADTVDHNSDTIDGLNTFHCMGIIAWVRNAKKCRLPAIKGVTIETNEIVETRKLVTKFFNFSCDIKPQKMFKNICCNVALDNTKVLGDLCQ